MGLQQVWLSYNQLFNLFFFFLFLHQLTCLHAQLCTQEQSSALLQFKRNFSFNKIASRECEVDFGITSFPKMESWKKGSDCCSWDGVECEGVTGQVIGLDLSCSWLQGAIHLNSSLFLSFPHLRKLSLAHNDFSMSPISLEFTRFTELKHLDLSWSAFSGNVPLELSFLNKLVLLDLSVNRDLRLEEGGFELLTQNLSKLRDLNLKGINMSSSVVPKSLLNLTSLRTLRLGYSGLHGEFPSGIFHLPHLQNLEIWDNGGLTGYIPDFINLTYPLRLLFLSNTGISGKLPDSIANLKSLQVLMVRDCKFHGSIPTSLWNLTQIRYIDLESNNFSGILPSSISNLTQITLLRLSSNNFSGILPSWISNLKKLAFLYLSHNYFTGPFFSWVANLPELQDLDVSNNFLTGPLPSQVVVPPNLYMLKIRRNLISGTIPSWVFGLPALKYLDLSYNKLIGHVLEFQSSSLEIIDLSNNYLHGTIPNSTFELPNLIYLLLSSNRFFGTIPELNRFSKNLIVLELQKNNFHGVVHDSLTGPNCLETINLNSNGFEGPVPRSLVHCRELKVLDLGNNKFCDEFPSWLEHLPKLHILILRSNRFHGPMQTIKTKFPFPSLRVIDMSENYLTGPLPDEYFRYFQAMVNVDERHLGLQYMGNVGYYINSDYYYYSLIMVIKGSVIEMEKVLAYFIAIDVSNNQFEGKIPEIIGRLNSLRGLNLSYNRLTGQIPTSFGNLTKLESLDLSSNKLSGEIPQHLANLEWLQVLNLSHNQLTGRIPRSKHLDTFSNASYINNLALCGPPLSNSCSDSGPPEPPPSMFQQEEDSQFASELDWEVILPGYGFGLVFGLVMGYLMFSFRKPQRFVKMIEGVGSRREKRVRRNAQRHGGRRT